MMETVRSHRLFQICSNRSSDSLNRFCSEFQKQVKRETNKDTGKHVQCCELRRQANNDYVQSML